MKKLFFILLCVPLIGLGQNFCNVYGSIKFVDFGEDYKVKFVDFGEDIKIKYVNFGANKSGQWRIVNFGENYKLKQVAFGEDFRVKIVGFGEGCNSSEYQLKSYVNTYIPDGAAIGATKANAVITHLYTSRFLTRYRKVKKRLKNNETVIIGVGRGEKFYNKRDEEENHGFSFYFTSNPLLIYIPKSRGRYMGRYASTDCICERYVGPVVNGGVFIPKNSAYYLCKWNYNKGMVWGSQYAPLHHFMLHFKDGDLYMYSNKNSDVWGIFAKWKWLTIYHNIESYNF
jgi:hypothetical protein